MRYILPASCVLFQFANFSIAQMALEQVKRNQQGNSSRLKSFVREM